MAWHRGTGPAVAIGELAPENRCQRMEQFVNLGISSPRKVRGVHARFRRRRIRPVLAARETAPARRILTAERATDE